jgi:hypothetical protein
MSWSIHRMSRRNPQVWSQSVNIVAAINMGLQGPSAPAERLKVAVDTACPSQFANLAAVPRRSNGRDRGDPQTS